MKVISNIEELKKTPVSRMSIGNFDGIHLGHQAIIKEVLKRNPSLIVTFDPHPRKVLSNNSLPGLLTSGEEKIDILEKLGVENLFILKFSHQIAKMEPEAFVRWLIVDYIQPDEVVIGYNHRFGYQAEGNFELLVHMGVKYGFKVTRVAPVYVDGFPVSSTRVRNMLLQGDMDKAIQLLGRPYSIYSHVIPGKRRGRSIAYPTANLELPRRKLLPKEGVYAVRVRHNGANLPGMLDIGDRPTFADSQGLGIEVHILDFNGNLIDHNLTVEFINYIRENYAFKRLEDLKNRLKDDERRVRSLLGG